MAPQTRKSAVIPLLLMLHLNAINNSEIRRNRKRAMRRVQRDMQRDAFIAFTRRRRQQMTMFMVMAILYSSSRIVDPDANLLHNNRSLWWETCVVPHYTDRDWLRNFRMKRATFFLLVEELRPAMPLKQDTNCKLAIPLEKRVAVAIWRLATPCEYRTIGHLFGIARSTACKFVNEVCSAIMLTVYPTCIKWPTGDRLKEVLRGFEVHRRYPQCAGAIDGTHIQIQAPADNHNDYHNRKGFTSIILQAVCDHQLRFTDVFVGWAGRAHDARVLRNSSLYLRGMQNTLFPLWTKQIQGSDIPIHIIGDPAYPLLDWLMKGYPDNGQLTQAQKRFNFRLSSARMVIEMAFGQLKGRWRSIGQRNASKLDFMPLIVSACCALHNFCIDHDDPFHRAHLDLPRAFDVFVEPVYHHAIAALQAGGPVPPLPNLPNPKDMREALTQHF